MIGFDEAQSVLAAAIKPLSAETVPLAKAHGRVLAEPIHAALSAPRRNVSAMDGYALRDADAAIGARFRVVGQSFAGGPVPPAIKAGEAMRIFTGATMPAGADRVVMQENCEPDGATMTIAAPYGPGWHVRTAGCDFAEGDLLLPAGAWIDPLAMVALAGADHASAVVHRAPRVAIIATGDELAPPGTARGNPLAIPESVSFGAAAMAERFGGSIVGRFTGADNLPTLEGIARAALDNADLVVVTGGASVGERDYAKAMFGTFGLDLLFANVAIKPGKPVWLGRAQDCWILGLPGNPTSAMVTARLFLAPLLAALQGADLADVLDWEPAIMATALPAPGQRTNFVRAKRVAGRMVPIGNQDSGAQASLADARWLLRCDPGVDLFADDGSLLALRL
ncbi:MAG: molybdopterin molybdotransferase MoeA [Proteobacteria bacterium]|nr:molybdopterin molybdotransferase MoeA [Pseudomonadota bacterium]